MNIQSSLNSMIGTIGYSAGLGKYFLGAEEQSKWFGSAKTTKEQRQASILDRKKLKERQGMDPADRVAEGQQRILQKEYEDSGQAEADALAEAMYNEQIASAGEAKALQNIVEKTETFHNQKEGLAQRKEYLRKPRILNRHGTIYQEVMKDGK